MLGNTCRRVKRVGRTSQRERRKRIDLGKEEKGERSRRERMRKGGGGGGEEDGSNATD